MLPDESTGWIFVSSSDVVNSRQRSVSVQLILFLFEVECKSVTNIIGRACITITDKYFRRACIPIYKNFSHGFSVH